MNIKNELGRIIANREKRPAPLAFYPARKQIGATMKELLEDSGVQASCMLEMQECLDPAMVIRMTELWIEAEAFGAEIEITDDWFPVIKSRVVSDIEDISDLKIPDLNAGHLPVFLDAMSKARAQKPARPLIAGVTGPFSLCGCLMDAQEFMISCHSEPEAAHELVGRVSDFIIAYCKAYQRVGADGVMLAEPSIGMISPKMAEVFSHAYVKKLIAEVQREDFAVIYHNCGEVSRHMRGIGDLGAMAYHFGDAFPLELALDTFPKDVLIMGNVHPAKFMAENESQLRASARALSGAFKGYDNFLPSSGCDISPGASMELIGKFCSEWSRFD